MIPSLGETICKVFILCEECCLTISTSMKISQNAALPQSYVHR